ncbi:MAG: glycosyl hydrolase family 18 protein [Actinomycetota bacterium]|nr:glycosyl hydrolase family 18 protein [Actinomycetota bacterium]
MKQLKLLLALLLTIAMAALMASPVGANEDITPITEVETPTAIPALPVITGWLPYWDDAPGTATLVANSDLIAETMPFWWSTVGNTQSVSLKIKSSGTTLAKRTRLIGQLQAAGILVLPTITDSTCVNTSASTLPAIFASDQNRANYIAQIVQLSARENYDGIDLDLECFMYESRLWSSYQANWVKFVAELGVALRAQGDLLSVTTPPIYSDTTGYWVYSWKQLGPHVDRLRIMAYDYSTGQSRWNPAVKSQGDGAIAPMQWVQRIVDYAVSVVDPAKVWLGVPAYGRNWVTGVTGSCPTSGEVPNLERVTWTSKEVNAKLTELAVTPTVSRYHSIHKERNLIYTRTFNGTNNAGVARSCTVTRTVWWQDARSHYDRLIVARKAGMAGIAVWRLNGEDAEMWTRTRPYAQSISEQPLTVELTQQQIANLGELATLSALLRPTTAAGASRSIANVPIQLQQQNPDMSWSDVATGLTDATGAAVFSINAVLARFRVSTQAVAGTWKSTTSAELLPAITRTIEITKQTATPTKKRGFKLSGIVSPAALDNPIELQRKVGRSWSTVATAALTQTGEFKLQWRKPPAGITALRLTSAATANYPAVLMKLGKVPIK